MRPLAALRDPYGASQDTRGTRVCLRLELPEIKYPGSTLHPHFVYPGTLVTDLKAVLTLASEDRLYIMTSEENNALRQRYELLKGAEHHKNALIEVYYHCHPSRMECILTTTRNFYAVWISSRKIITRRGWIMLVNHTLIGMFKGENWNYKRNCANTKQLWWVRSVWLTRTSFERSSDTLGLQ